MCTLPYFAYYFYTDIPDYVMGKEAVRLLMQKIALPGESIVPLVLVP
jgi:hypothetical protein